MKLFNNFFFHYCKTGNIHLIGSKSLHVVLEELSKIYGKVFSLKLGAHRTVILCDKKSMKEAFVKKAKDFIGRPQLPTFVNTLQGCTGISLTDHNEEYTQNRKLTMTSLHRFLRDTQNVDKILQIEARKAEAHFDSYAETGGEFFPLDVFEKVIPSMFLAMMYGVDLSYEDEDLKHITSVYRRWFEAAEADNPADFFPTLARFPNKRLSIITKVANEMEKFNINMVRQRLQVLQKELNNNGNSKKCDAIMDFMVDGEDFDAFDDDIFCREITKIASDVVGGGFDTSASTASYAILYLIQHPEIVEKCRTELCKVAREDGDRLSMEAKSKCPYFMATIHEILRMSCVAPTGLLHLTKRESSIQGYAVPKDTIVIANLRQINFDSQEWPEPHQFRPERFLNANGDKALNTRACNEIATFSAGMRRCPGDKLGISMIFVLLGTLIKRYDFDLVKAPVDMEPIRGITSKPKHYLLKLST